MTKSNFKQHTVLLNVQPTLTMQSALLKGCYACLQSVHGPGQANSLPATMSCLPVMLVIRSKLPVATAKISASVCDTIWVMDSSLKVM